MQHHEQQAPLIELRDIRKRFPGGDQDVEVLHGISLTIEAGVAWTGPARANTASPART